MFDEYLSKTNDIQSTRPSSDVNVSVDSIVKMARAARHLCWLAEINRLERFEEGCKDLVGLAGASEETLAEVNEWIVGLKNAINFDEYMASQQVIPHDVRDSDRALDSVSEEVKPPRDIQIEKRDRGSLLYSIFRALSIIREEWEVPLVHAVLQADLTGVHIDEIALLDVITKIQTSVKIEKHPALVGIAKQLNNALTTLVRTVGSANIEVDSDSASVDKHDKRVSYLEIVINAFSELKKVLDWVCSMLVRTKESTKFSNGSKGLITVEYRPPSAAHFELLNADTGDFMTIGGDAAVLQRLFSIDGVELICERITSDAVMFKLASALPAADGDQEYAYLASFDVHSNLQLKLLGRQYSSDRKQIRAVITEKTDIDSSDIARTDASVVIIFEFDLRESSGFNFASRLQLILQHLWAYASQRMRAQTPSATSFADFDLVLDIHSIASSFAVAQGSSSPLKSELFETSRSIDRIVSALKDRCHLLSLTRAGYDIATMRPWSTTWLDLQKMIQNLTNVSIVK